MLRKCNDRLVSTQKSITQEHSRRCGIRATVRSVPRPRRDGSTRLRSFPYDWHRFHNIRGTRTENPETSSHSSDVYFNPSQYISKDVKKLLTLTIFYSNVESSWVGAIVARTAQVPSEQGRSRKRTQSAMTRRTSMVAGTQSERDPRLMVVVMLTPRDARCAATACGRLVGQGNCHPVGDYLPHRREPR